MNLEDRARARLARIPHEPNLDRKRTLGIQARELLEAAGEPDAANAVMLDRHAIELPEHRPSPLLTAQEAGPPPARDPFVETAAGAPANALNDALVLAEVAAATATEVEDPATRMRLARFAAQRLEETVALERDEAWGAVPVDVGAYARLMALATADRVEQLIGEGGGRDEDAVV